MAAGKGQSGNKSIPKCYRFRGCCFCSKHLLNTYCVYASAYSGFWDKNEMQINSYPLRRQPVQLHRPFFSEDLWSPPRFGVFSLAVSPVCGALPALSPKYPLSGEIFSDSLSAVANPHLILFNPCPLLLPRNTYHRLKLYLFALWFTVCVPTPENVNSMRAETFSVGPPAPVRYLAQSRCPINICLTDGK